jgi:hypothetical protein
MGSTRTVGQHRPYERRCTGVFGALSEKAKDA